MRADFLFALFVLSVFSFGTPSAQAMRGISEALEAAVVVDGAIVGLAEEGAIVRSVDEGESFEELWRPAASDTLLSMAASGQTVIAGGGAGLLVRAENLAENPEGWDEVSSGSFLGDVLGLAHDGGENWVAVGDAGFSAGVLLSFDEGATWAPVANPPPHGLHAVEWNASASEWVAAGGDGFNGAVYRSADGADWVESSVPFGTPSLRDLAVDEDGRIFAVGESGAMLLSTDGGETFATVGEGLVSEDLNTVVSSGADQWVVAGTEAVVLSVSGGTAGILFEPDPSKPAIQSLVVMENGSVILLGRELIPDDDEVEPLRLRIERLPEGELRLLLSHSREDASYQLETSDDLVQWSEVGGVRGGVGDQLDWEVAPTGTARFFRVVETSSEDP